MSKEIPIKGVLCGRLKNRPYSWASFASQRTRQINNSTRNRMGARSRNLQEPDAITCDDFPHELLISIDDIRQMSITDFCKIFRGMFKVEGSKIVLDD